VTSLYFSGRGEELKALLRIGIIAVLLLAKRPQRIGRDRDFNTYREGKQGLYGKLLDRNLGGSRGQRNAAKFMILKKIPGR